MAEPPDNVEVAGALGRLKAELSDARAMAARTVRELWRLQAQSQRLQAESQRLVWELQQLQTRRHAWQAHKE
jgi:hypothetical protein